MPYRRKKLLSEINVVPYIDVVLVLLIIFMITAPLITQGVKVDLPVAPSEVLPPSSFEPIVVTVDAQGRAYSDLGTDPKNSITDEVLVARISAVLRLKPQTRILIRGDQLTAYGRVVQIMSKLQSAGADKIGMITQPELL